MQWGSVPTNADPIVSPTMAGGLFAIERKWFFESGWYDEGMKVLRTRLRSRHTRNAQIFA